jgi:pimeloyl-ACP methyl ester carboxylesterase
VRTGQTRSGRLGYTVSGQGSPTMVLFNGAGVGLEGWQPLHPDIERLGTVLAWNRFGMQGSDPPARRQTGTVVIASLRELLGSAGLAPPYLLVGHSLGGLYANLFARLYPRETAGVLLLEATHPADHVVLKQHVPQLVRALANVLTLPRRLFQRNVEAELACVEDTVRELEAAGEFPAVPLRVVTGGLSPKGWLDSPGAVAARRMHQQELARLSPLGEQVIAHRSGHFPQLTQPDLVLDAIADLARSAAKSFSRPEATSPA